MSLLLRSTRLLTLGTQLAKSNLVQNKQFSISLRLAQLKFTNQHEWVKVEGNVGTIGITDYAQDKLGEVVYLELPEVGAEFEQSSKNSTNYIKKKLVIFSRPICYIGKCKSCQ